MNFPDHGINRKVVNNDVIHLNVHYERNSLACFQENPEKPDFSKIAYKKKNEIFFRKNRQNGSRLLQKMQKKLIFGHKRAPQKIGDFCWPIGHF